eukprot:7425064-Pyramimonas_sp.AAC.1
MGSTGTRQHDNTSAKKAKQIEMIISPIEQKEFSHVIRIYPPTDLHPETMLFMLNSQTEGYV